MGKPQTPKSTEPYDETDFQRKKEARLREEGLRDPHILSSRIETETPVSETPHRLLPRRADPTPPPETSKPKLIKRLRSLESEEPDLPILRELASMQVSDSLEELENNKAIIAEPYLRKILDEAQAQNPNLSREEEDEILFYGLQEWEDKLSEECKMVYQLINKEGISSFVYQNFKNNLDGLIRLAPKGAIQEAQAKDPYFPEEEDFIESIKSKAKHKLGKQVVNELYKLFLFAKKEYGSSYWELFQWLTRSKVWQGWPERKQKRFGKIFSYLVELVKPYSQYSKKMKDVVQKAKGRWTEEIKDAVFLLDWEQASKDLEMSVHHLRRWIWGFVGAGILKILPIGIGKGGQNIYSIGEYKSPYGRWPKLFLYLKESETIVEDGKPKIRRTLILEKLEEMKLPIY